MLKNKLSAFKKCKNCLKTKKLTRIYQKLPKFIM